MIGKTEDDTSQSRHTLFIDTRLEKLQTLMKYQLEKYRGSRSRYTCPSCGKKNEFARYIDELGDYLDSSVGRCNRESSCGYHLTPKEFLGLGTQSGTNAPATGKTRMNAAVVTRINAASRKEQAEYFDTIDNSLVVRSLEHTNKNRFLNFLLSFVDPELVEKMIKDYLIGTTKTGKTVFWQIDDKGRARTGKIISYDEKTGKRDKRVNPSWIHYELKKTKVLAETFEHKICFFGEHLLKRDKRKSVAIVEAEKTAAVASIFLDNFIWLAIGGKSYLKAEKLRRFRGRKIILFPDADGFDLWQREAIEAQRFGLNVTTSRIIEDAATVEEKKGGFDLADYLIAGELKARRHNGYTDAYNSKVNKILSDEYLFDLFNEMLDERVAIMESEEEALKPENLRAIVEFIA